MTLRGRIEQEVSEMDQSGATGPPANYQTVKLSRGRHYSPDDGVCVMELASMLAEEPFSDRAQMCREWLRQMRGRMTVPEELPDPSSQPGRLRGWRMAIEGLPAVRG